MPERWILSYRNFLLGGSLHPKENELTTTAGKADAHTFPADSLSERKGLDMERRKGTEIKRVGEAEPAAKSNSTDAIREQGMPAISTPHDKGLRRQWWRKS